LNVIQKPTRVVVVVLGCDLMLSGTSTGAMQQLWLEPYIPRHGKK